MRLTKSFLLSEIVRWIFAFIMLVAKEHCRGKAFSKTAYEFHVGSLRPNLSVRLKYRTQLHNNRKLLNSISQNPKNHIRHRCICGGILRRNTFLQELSKQNGYLSIHIALEDIVYHQFYSIFL